MPRPVQIVRVFTRDGAGGNHLGVVSDISDLTGDQMQQIAADLGFSETTFVDWVGRDVPYVRIFTPQVEMEFAGHPLVGTSWVMNVIGPGGVARMECPVGIVDTAVDGEIVWIDAALGQAVSPRDGELASRAGIGRPLRGWVVDMPKEYTVYELGSAADVVALAPDLSVVAETFGLLAFSREGDSVKSRFFAPAGGVDEDPATGSAAVALAAVLVSAGERSGSVTIEQGDEIDAPSTIRLEWDGDRARIGGTVVRVEARFLEI